MYTFPFSLLCPKKVAIANLIGVGIAKFFKNQTRSRCKPIASILSGSVRNKIDYRHSPGKTPNKKNDAQIYVCRFFIF